MAEQKESTTVIDDNQVEMDVGEFVEADVSLDAPDTTVEPPVVEHEDEVEKHSESVQKRINNLTKKMRTAEREKDEAINYAKNVHNENERVKERLKQVDQGYMAEYAGRLQAEEKAAENAYKAAIRSGNPDASLAAQTSLTNIQVNKQKLNEAKRIAEARTALETDQRESARNGNGQAQQQQAPPAPVIDDKALEWARNNKWFSMTNTGERDVAMTGAARAIHEVLVQEEGFDPRTNEYYDEIDRRIRDLFPDNFSHGQSKRAAQTVAGVSRQTSGRKNTVRLSASERKIAQQLGVPEHEYAKRKKELQGRV